MENLTRTELLEELQSAQEKIALFDDVSRKLGLDIIQNSDTLLKILIEKINTEKALLEKSIALERANEELQTLVETLHVTQKAAIKAEKYSVLKHLVTGIAHEMNTPLGVSITGVSSINNAIELLQNSINNGTIKRKELTSKLENCASTSSIVMESLYRASTLISQFKEATALECNRSFEEITLESYFKDLFTELLGHYKKDFITFSVRSTSDIVVMWDKTHLRQIFTHLIRNSLDHGLLECVTPNRHGEVKLTISKNLNKVLLCYSDNGKGMGKEEVKNIFTPFYTTKRGTGRVGLGMYVVYNLINNFFDGNVKCFSNAGKGCSVLISVPEKVR